VYSESVKNRVSVSVCSGPFKLVSFKFQALYPELPGGHVTVVTAGRAGRGFILGVSFQVAEQGREGLRAANFGQDST
jgi:hypothetical protein